jgi:cation transport ATPase
MVGDIVMVEQGDRLLMDGVVVSGSPIFEELMISGTSRQQKVPIQTSPL